MSGRFRETPASGRRLAGGDAGYSLIELLVSVFLTMIITAAVGQLVVPAQTLSQVQPEVSDLHQRLRAAADPLLHDLLVAGAGPPRGRAAGSLARYFAPILPYRAGPHGGDAPGVVYRPDALTLVWVPPAAAQAVMGEVVAADATSVRIGAPEGCPAGDPACGFREGMDVLLLGDEGVWERLAVTAVVGDRLEIARPGPPRAFAAGATLVGAEFRTYWLDTATDRLMREDSGGISMPLVDHVVALTITYFDDAMRELGGGVLSDGPWCEVGGPSPFDADLFGVRAVRVSLRVEVASAAFRGASPLLFERPGTASGGGRLVPDWRLAFDVAPRNLGLPR